jgi:nucleotide-binding universal stress UspA family protein
MTNCHRESQAELRLDQILVPIDFSARSRQALKVSVWLADEFEAGLHLLYVSEKPSLLPGVEAPSYARRTDQVARRGQLALAELAKREIPSAIGATLSVRRGKPSLAINTTAARLGVDLIIISSHGQSGVKRLLLGSTAEQVIRQGPCPVLVVRKVSRDRKGRGNRTMPAIKRVVVPVDFSEASRQALRYAAAFARRINAGLILLHVIAPLNVPRRLALEMDRLQLESLERAKSSLEELAEREIGHGQAINTRVVAGRVFERIVRLAGEVESDLIIIGTHGAGGVKRLLLGSTAENVVRHAPCPVLIVRERKRRPGRVAGTEVLKGEGE